MRRLPVPMRIALGSRAGIVLASASRIGRPSSAALWASLAVMGDNKDTRRPRSLECGDNRDTQALLCI
eukprot:scaffold98851_cov69-Phaeocystis_antarctica.AAC.3